MKTLPDQFVKWQLPVVVTVYLIRGINQVKLMFKLYSLLTILMISTVAGHAQQYKKRMDTLLSSYVQQHQFNGNVLIVEKSIPMFENCYGLADRENSVPNKPATRFRIASISKQFTAVLILQLVEAGKLNLDAPISRYLPFYPKPWGNNITIHHLLTHTSGLPEYTEKAGFFDEISKRSYTHQEFIKQFCSDSLLTAPGTTYKYCNTGYYILGAIIEAITGKSYAEVLQTKILNVAGMQHTGMETNDTLIFDRARGYNYRDSTYFNAEYIDMLSSIFSAGGLYSTIRDLWLWNKALFNDKLISKASRNKMMQPYMAGYGYGIGVTKFTPPGLDQEVHFAFHQGAINGFRSFMTYIVNEDRLIILLCNNFDVDLNRLNNAIFAVLHDQPHEVTDK